MSIDLQRTDPKSNPALNQNCSGDSKLSSKFNVLTHLSLKCLCSGQVASPEWLHYCCGICEKHLDIRKC